MYKLPLIVLAAFAFYCAVCLITIKIRQKKSHSASGMTLKESADIYSPIMPSGNTYCTALNEL